MMYRNSIFFALILVFGFTFAKANISDLESLTARYGFKIKKSFKFELVKNESQEALGKAFQKIFLKNSKAEVEIEILGPTDEKNAKLIIDSAYRTIEDSGNASVNGSRQTIPTNANLKCPEDLILKKQKKKILGAEVMIYFGKASTQKTFGVCSKDKTTFDALFYMFHLNKQYLVKTTLFSPQKSSQKIDLKPLNPYLQIYELVKQK